MRALAVLAIMMRVLAETPAPLKSGQSRLDHAAGRDTSRSCDSLTALGIGLEICREELGCEVGTAELSMAPADPAWCPTPGGHPTPDGLLPQTNEKG